MIYGELGESTKQIRIRSIVWEGIWVNQSTNGSDPIYDRMGGSTKRTYEYNHNNTHDNLTYYGEEWVNGTDPNGYCTYLVLYLQSQQVQYVQYLCIINKHTH